VTQVEAVFGHAGEWFDELQCARTLGLAKPVLMSDALSSNPVTETDYSLKNADSEW
jgi:transposase